MKKFNKEVTPSEVVVTTESPTQQASISSDVMVPLLQAVISGGTVATLVALGINEFVADFSGNLFKVWAFWALLLSTTFWIALLIDTRKLLRRIEKVFDVDLDGDGYAGPPVEVRRAAGYRLTQGGQQVVPKTADPERLITIDPEQGNLVWFALFAIRLQDLSVKTLTLKPVPRLPFKEIDRRGLPKELYLRKSMITKLLKRGAKVGWWAGPEPGAPAHFTHSRQTVRQQALAMWCEVMKDTPPPDYWSDTEYKTVREE